jgi:hypothetical protein
MQPLLKKVRVLSDYRLGLTFANGERRCCDMRPYLSKGVFAQLRDPQVFSSAHVSFDTVAWSNGADLCPEVLYNHSIRIS